jgi:endonuclease YncB( thermonuclease family)
LLLALPGLCLDTPAFSGTVVGIADGDTIKVLHENKVESIRLKGIDCPEKRQPFGMRAKQFASNMCFGKEVTISEGKRDKYKRLVADVILPDGRILNQELVRSGFAWWYKQFSPHDEILNQLELQARQAHLGLWGEPHPEPPWLFRKIKKKVLLAGGVSEL